MLATEGTAVLALADPLLDALGVEDVLLVAVERGDEVVAQEVAPADGALPPQPAHALVQPRLLLKRRLLVLELRLVQRRDNLWHGERDRQQATEHALDEKIRSVLSLRLSDVVLELLEGHRIRCFSIVALLLQISSAHHVDSSLNDGFDKASALKHDYKADYVVEADEVAEH